MSAFWVKFSILKVYSLLIYIIVFAELQRLPFQLSNRLSCLKQIKQVGCLKQEHVKNSQRHFCTKGHICTEGHFCTKITLHKDAFAQRVTFARGVTLARRVTFAGRVVFARE